MIDVIIIGAGPAGVTAAIYLKRANINFMLIEGQMIGGKVNYTAEVDNYPPLKHISGPDLAMAYFDDLMHNNIEVQYENVISLKKENDIFIVKTETKEYQAKAVIVATGTSDKLLGVKGEDKLFHKGISTCALCDGNLFKGQTMAVVGGGNSALEETLYLSKISPKIYLIHRRNEFRGNQQYLSRIKETDNVEILTPFIIKECVGEEKLESLILENVETKQEKVLKISALFEYVGLLPNTSFIDIKEVLDEKGFVITNQVNQTSVEGLFAVGDVVSNSLRQIVVASSQGAIASQSVISFLEK